MAIQTIRNLTPALSACAYFQTSGFSPKPTPVIDEVVRWLRYGSQGPAIPEVGEALQAALEEARSAVARTLGADPDEVMLNENTTVGINIVANGIDWRPGDNVILSDHEHPGNRIPWYNLATRYGVELRFLRIGNDPAELLAQFEALLDGRTRVASLSHVSRRTGVRLPAAELSEIAHQHGVPLLLDGAQAFGAIPMDVHALGCDFYTCSGHKYIMGPQGTGAFYVRRDMLEWLKPSWIGSHSQETMGFDGHMTLKASARRFEFATRNIADQSGVRRAIELWEAVGWESVFATISAFTAEMKRKLAELPGLEIITPLPYEQSSGIVTFRISGLPSGQIWPSLWEHERVLVAPLNGDDEMVRVSTHAFNTTQECDRLVTGLRRMIR
jgi:L-cysteine/cystine lyase